MSPLAVGLMAGTSLDGIDAALVEVDDARIELKAFRSASYPDDVARLLSEVLNGAPVASVALLHVQLGEAFAGVAVDLLRESGTVPGRVSFIASHGQTVWHEPAKASLQLGDPSVIAERTGIAVVSDFRARDIASGGQGAPLVPIADALVFARADGPRILLNVGGVANVSWVPLAGDLAGVIAFDTGPGVTLIDAIARAVDPQRPYDIDGRLAAEGNARPGILKAALDDPYFRLAPPKSTGRERFGTDFALRLLEDVREGAGSDADAVATAVALTARSIADQLERWLPTVGTLPDIVISGGGARNPVLLDAVCEAVAPKVVRRFDELFFDGDAKEAAAFAFLGWLSLEGRPGNVVAATGARGARVLGSVTPA